MLTRKIPGTGEDLPVVGVGTWERFDVPSSDPRKAKLQEVLATLFAAGGRVIDSSPMYGRAEGVVGELLAAMPEPPKPFIATKVWTTGKAEGVAEMQRSEQLMGGRLDLIQVHNLLDWRTHLKTLESWKAEGRIRYIGITHYTPSAHAELESVLKAGAWDFVQLDYSLEDRAAEARLLPLAAERGVAVIVNRPLGGGGLIRRLVKQPLPGWAAQQGYGSWAGLLLKFILANPAVTCVIPGTGDPAHMAEFVEAGKGEPLDAASLNRLLGVLNY
jgi:diketogulonate reductase-like aldo/keto reductase